MGLLLVVRTPTSEAAGGSDSGVGEATRSGGLAVQGDKEGAYICCCGGAREAEEAAGLGHGVAADVVARQEE